MNWNIFDQPIAQEWVRALCLTLMHSLWQGLIAAIAAAAILLCTRKSKPAFRYNLLASVMLAFMAGTIGTFGLILRNAPVALGSISAQSMSWGQQTAFLDDAGMTTIAMAGVMSEGSWIKYAVDFCSMHAQLIVTVWFLIFALKSLQAASGLRYLSKVTKSVSTPEMKWIVRFYELTERMRIGQEVELCESDQVTVPMVIGFLKPVVLVPLGMLANLPAAQVEAILLHELAHIRRRDYLTNLAQIFCENVFFFNPAVWWISKLIREEREHCCDDLAISVMQNKVSFIHALVSFQEYNQSRPVFEVAFSKKRNHLLDRIKRIVNNNNKPLDAMEKLFVTFSLAAAIALSAATAPEKQAKSERSPAATENRADATILSQKKTEAVSLSEDHDVLASGQDTLPRKKMRSEEMEIHSANVHSARQGISTYNVTRNNRQYEIVQRNGKIVSLWVDDKEIAESDYGKYQPEIDKIMAEIKIQHQAAEKQREQAEVQRKQADEMRKLAEVQRRDADKLREEANTLRLEAGKQREEAAQIRVNANTNREQADNIRQEAGKYREAAEDMRKQADQMRQLANKQRGEAEVMRERAEEHRKVAEKDREAYIKIQDGVISELTQAGLVKDKESLSYRLSDDELIVNGEKQPAELHRKLKAKYLKELGDKKFELMYNYNNQNGHIKTGIISPREE
jgi:bla regulator protein BlaR1